MDLLQAKGFNWGEDWRKAQLEAVLSNTGIWVAAKLDAGRVILVRGFWVADSLRHWQSSSGTWILGHWQARALAELFWFVISQSPLAQSAGRNLVNRSWTPSMDDSCFRR